MFNVFNVIFLVLMTLLSASQIGLIWLHIKCRQRVPLSNRLMASGTLLLTLAAYLGFRTAIYQSVFGFVVLVSGLILTLIGCILSYRQINRQLKVNKTY